MSLFEFLMVMVSIIIGLAMSELLTGVARLIRSRSETRAYWVQLVLVTAVFIVLVQQWWEFWQLRELQEWTFALVLLYLSELVGLFLIAHLLFPEHVRGADLHAYYHGEMRAVWWIGVVTILIAMSFWHVAVGHPVFIADNISTLIGLCAFIVLGVSQRPLLHKTLVPLFLLLSIWDVVQFSFVVSNT